jgi:hypothetical protein
MHAWWWFNRYESVNYPVHHNRLGSQTAMLEPANIRTKCYTTFVRPQLEYASSVWATHTQSNINKLESVQRRAARFATGNYNTISSVTTILKTTMLAQGRDYVQLKTRSAVLESDCLDFLFEGFRVQGCCCGLTPPLFDHN